ncbi:DapH/DapD/GlmU-related protein, partial [Rhizobium ruizarguesonis]
ADADDTLAVYRNVRIVEAMIEADDRCMLGNPHAMTARHLAGNTGIVIGDDVWIGANCVILDGATIGNGAVIAAGAVVTGDIPAMEIAGGVPARVLRSRGSAPRKSGTGDI